MSNPSPPSGDAELRKILDDVAAGRLTVDQALWQIKNLMPPASQVRAVASLLGPALRQRTRTRGGAWIAGFILLLVGSIFTAAGTAVSWRSLQLLQGGQKADGVVVSMRHDGDSSKPVVKYSVDGKEYEVVGTISTKPPSLHVGEQVQVVYRPGDPTYAVIDSFVERWLFPLIFGGIGLLLGSIGLLILVAKFFSLFSLLRPKPLEENERFTVE